MKTIGQAIIVDDFFSDAALYEIEQNNYEKLNYSDQRDSGICSRIQSEIECPIIDTELGNWLASSQLRDTIRDWADLSWRFAYNELVTGADIYLSRYTPGTAFEWHVDHWNRRAVLNWIVTLSGDGWIEWDTGAMDYGKGYEPTCDSAMTTLTANKLIVMPSYYPHSLIMSDEERVSLHGHFNVER